MKKEEIYGSLIIAIDPTPRGFAYAVLHDSNTLTDWGHRTFSFGRTRRSLKHIVELIDHYLPDHVVVKNTYVDNAQKSEHARRIAGSVESSCAKKYIPLEFISKQLVYETFGGFQIKNKSDIAKAVCNWFPELEDHRPARRKYNQNEKEQMHIFDAISLALTFYYRNRKSLAE